MKQNAGVLGIAAAVVVLIVLLVVLYQHFLGGAVNQSGQSFQRPGAGHEAPKGANVPAAPATH